MLIEKPSDVRMFAKNFFTDPNLRSLIESRMKEGGSESSVIEEIVDGLK